MKTLAKNTKKMIPLGLALGLTAMFTIANADVITTPSGSIGGGINYTITGDIATETGDGAGEDLRFTTNTGGAFTITFTGGVVDLSIYNSEINQAVNFDGNVGNSASVVANAGTWSYATGAYDLSSVVSGTGSDTLVVGNARTITGQPGSATSGAPFSETDWGTFSISGITTITYTFSDSTNFDGMRISATAVPEPATIGLLGLGTIIVLLARRRTCSVS